MGCGELLFKVSDSGAACGALLAKLDGEGVHEIVFGRRGGLEGWDAGSGYFLGA